MEIRAARASDVEAVLQLLADARRWHFEQGVDVWGKFDPAQVERDVQQGRVFLAIDATGACGTMTLEDAGSLVWGADEKGDALYLHRLASARTGPRKGVGACLIRRARLLAAQSGRKWLRLETWNANRKMRSYYEEQGFRHVRDEYFPLDSPLPADYRGTHKSLYQLEV
jgi:ribosomal protein S18 acetylase RimI-like enzyme